jgi:hypothetical protein
LGIFYKLAARIDGVCRHHSHVVEPGADILSFPARESVR